MTVFWLIRPEKWTFIKITMKNKNLHVVWKLSSSQTSQGAAEDEQYDLLNFREVSSYRFWQKRVHMLVSVVLSMSFSSNYTYHIVIQIIDEPQLHVFLALSVISTFSLRLGTRYFQKHICVIIPTSTEHFVDYLDHYSSESAILA